MQHVAMTFKLSPEPVPLEQAYDRLAALLPLLGDADDRFARWWLGPRMPKDTYVPFDNREEALARLRDIQSEFLSRYPDANLDPKQILSVLLTNAGEEGSWKKNGRVAMSYRPVRGALVLNIHDVGGLFQNPADVLWRMLVAFADIDGLTFAYTDVQQKVDGESKVYSLAYQVFPHRDILGWMGYVPKKLTAEQVPAAAKLEQVEKGTCISATEVLDLSKPQAIKQANQVEMALADLDLLAITDPTLW